jgi:FlaA1/EpsC-like NDP-sugar epimerase
VFVLEMGEPVRIMDLARDMIELSGLEPERDIAIEIVGRRSGEKLHEQLFDATERPIPTPAQRILRAERPPLDPAWVEDAFDQVGLLVLEATRPGWPPRSPSSQGPSRGTISPTRSGDPDARATA